MSYIFLDTETHSKENPILIQLAYKRDDVVFDELYSTGGPKIEFGAMAVHHITEKKLEGLKTFDESQEKQDLIKIISEYGDVLVAHNAKFDV